MSCPERPRERAVLAVARDRAVDEPRVLLAQALVADAEPVHHAGPEATRAARRARATSRSSTSRPPSVLRFEPDRALAAVEREEQRRRGRLVGALVVAAATSGCSRPSRCPRPSARRRRSRRAAASRSRPGAAAMRSRTRTPSERRRRSCRRAAAARPRLPSSSRASSTVAGAPADVLHHLARLRDQVAVRARHLAVRQVEVVLEARRARCRRAPRAAAISVHWSRLMPITPQLFAAPSGDLLGHVREVLRGRADPAGHAHHARHLERLATGGPCRSAGRGSPRGRSRSTRARAGCRARSSRSTNSMIVSNEFSKTVLKTKSFRCGGVLRVVHRAHVERRHVRPQLAQVLDPLLDRDADGAGRVVDDHVVRPRPGSPR